MPFLLPEGADFELLPNAAVQNGVLERSRKRSGHHPGNAAVQEAASESLAAAALSAGLLPGDLPRTDANEREDAAAWISSAPAAAHLAAPRPGSIEPEFQAAEAVPQQAAYFRDAGFALLGIMNPDGSISVIEPVAAPLPEPASPGGEGS